MRFIFYLFAKALKQLTHTHTLIWNSNGITQVTSRADYLIGLIKRETLKAR